MSETPDGERTIIDGIPDEHLWRIDGTLLYHARSVDPWACVDCGEVFETPGSAQSHQHHCNQ